MVFAVLYNLTLFLLTLPFCQLLIMAASPVQVQNVLNLSALGVPPDQVSIIIVSDLHTLDRLQLAN